MHAIPVILSYNQCTNERISYRARTLSFMLRYNSRALHKVIENRLVF